MVSPSTSSVPSQKPVCAKRWLSNITRPCERTKCCGSSKAGIAPVQVRSNASGCSVGSRDHPHAVQRLDHLDAERTDGRVHAVAELLRRAEHPLLRRSEHTHANASWVGEVRVLTHADDHEQLVGRAVQVEVVAVVEVAIAGAARAGSARRSGASGSRPSTRARDLQRREHMQARSMPAVDRADRRDGSRRSGWCGTTRPAVANADESPPPPLRSKKVVSGPSCSYASASSTCVVVSSSKWTSNPMPATYADRAVDR